MVASKGSLPSITSVDAETRRAFLEVLRRLTLVEAAAAGGGGGGVTAHSALTGLTVGDDHTQYLNNARGDARYPLKSNNLSEFTATAATARSNLGLGGAATANVGTTAGTVAAGDDSRITGAAQKSANLSDLTSASAARTALSLGTSATLNVPAAGDAAVGEVVKGNDTRLTNARTPSAHASTHSSAGSDPISHNNLAGLTTGDPHTQYQLRSEKNAASGYAGLDAGTKVAVAQIPTVTNAMLSTVNSATFKGRTTAGVGAPEDLTTAQATSMLDVFTSLLKGVVPASGGGTANFLRADGTWAAPPAGGAAAILANANTAVQNIGAAETYVTGSNVTIGGRVKAGTVIRWRLYLTKTAAGTAAPTISIKFGTAGTIADTTRVGPLAFVVQTNVVDRGWMDVECIVRSVSATGTVVGAVRFQHALTTTGFANQAQEQLLGAVSGTFDTSVAGLVAGLTLNPNTSASWGVEICTVQAFNLT